MPWTLLFLLVRPLPFFDTAAKVVVFGFVVVDYVVDVVFDEDNDISDVAVVAVSLNLLIVWFILPLD